MTGLEQNKFKNSAKLIAESMRKAERYDTASKLEDIIPLFEPHQFWDEQPVPKSTDFIAMGDDQFNVPIEVKTVADVSQEPYALPAQYSWDNLDLNDDDVAQEVYDLLVQNYVEDSDAMFRFDYSKPFLRWALLPPNGNPNWIVGVRAGKRQKLFGLITGIPVSMNLNGREV